jgi:serine/threonine protein phosphatase PrpC
MITCPECGQQAGDDAKFCDRCGQGLAGAPAHLPASSIAPLDAGTLLQGGYRITELLSQTSQENRYRAERSSEGSAETVQLREQLGPAHQAGEEQLSSKSHGGEDPSGPRAKTAELRSELLPNHAHASGSINGQGSQSPSASNEARPSMSVGVPEDLAGAGQEKSEKDAEVENGAAEATVQLLTDVVEEKQSAASPSGQESTAPNLSSSLEGSSTSANGQPDQETAANAPAHNDDLGELFGRVLALSLTLNHRAFQRAIAGFAERDRVYLVYPDEELRTLASRPGGLLTDEREALQVAIQVCQAVSFVHRRGLRVNDICPDSVAFDADGRIKLTGLDYISNDNELQSQPVFNDGYTAPEIYRGKKADKRADIFSIGALLYTSVTGERLESETWREEAGSIRFYPPHVVTPALEQTLRRALQFDPEARWSNVEAFKAELVKLASAISIRADALTDVGRVREHNEDSVLAFECKRDSLIDPAQTFLYVVADGMGGAEAGEVASAIAIKTIRKYVEDKRASSDAGDLCAILREALEQANSKIIEYQAAHPEARSMGSTAVAALINPPDAAIGWVGDSRAYISDGLHLHQLSKDHSLVQRLIEIGQISVEEARHHEHKNVITRSLGARPSGLAGAESRLVRLKRGDRLLLCSDGLTAHVEDREISEVLRRHTDPTAAARELVVAANAGGGTDNISVVVIVAG